MSEPIQEGAPTPRRFRTVNLKLAGLWAVAAAIGFAVFSAIRFPINYAGLIVGLYGLVAVVSSLRGVTVDERIIAAPRALTPALPFLVLGRSKVELADLRDITSLGAVLGLEAVGIASQEGQTPVLFSSRAKRIAFFDAVKAFKPDVRIYRAV